MSIAYDAKDYPEAIKQHLIALIDNDPRCGGAGSASTNLRRRLALGGANAWLLAHFQKPRRL